MSEPDDPPQSAAPYIIICSGRTQVLAAKDPVGQIVAVNQCAADLCSFLQSNYDTNPADFQAISIKQHELMDGMLTLKRSEVDAKIAEMFVLFDELEDKYT